MACMHVPAFWKIPHEHLTGRGRGQASPLISWYKWKRAENTKVFLSLELGDGKVRGQGEDGGGVVLIQNWNSLAVKSWATLPCVLRDSRVQPSETAQAEFLSLSLYPGASWPRRGAAPDP